MIIKRAASIKTLFLTGAFVFAGVFYAAAADNPAPVSGMVSSQAVTGSAEAVTKAAKPGSPDLLQATTDSMKVSLVWGSYENDKITFNIYRSTSDKDGFVKINKAPVSDNQFDDTKETSLEPLKSNVTYYYYLTAADDGVESDASNTLFVTPVGTLSAPDDVTAAGGMNSIKLKWTQPEASGLFGVSGYNIFRSTGSALFSQLNAATITAVEYDDTGLTNGARYSYMLQTVDTIGNTSPLSAAITSEPYEAVSTPAKVTAQAVSSESIKLSWDAPKSGTFEVSGYNIYRSTDPANFPREPLNPAVWPGLKGDDGKIFYHDNMIWSSSKPLPGTEYYYKIIPVDSGGNMGAPSDAVKGVIQLVNVQQTGMLTADISQYGLPPESSLSLSGKKSLQMSYEHIWWKNTTNQPDNFDIQQKLRLKLTGNIGTKIKVDVNYDETLLTDEYTKISISYTGDKDETLQDVEFGDMTLQVPSTKYLSYSPQQLFGIKGKVQFGDKMALTLLAAQSKGITDIQTFTGNLRKKVTNGRSGVDIYDTGYITGQYYYLTKNPKVVIKPGSVMIYRDDAVATDDATAIPSSDGKFHFDLLYSGVDYVVDYNTNIVKFTTPIPYNYVVAVGYIYSNASTNELNVNVGLSSPGVFNFDNRDDHFQAPALNNGYTDPTHTLIQDGTKADIYNKLVDYYSMQGTQIYNPMDKTNFQILIQKSDGTVTYSCPQPGDTNANQYYTIDTDFGILKFNSYYPFAAALQNPAPLAPTVTAQAGAGANTTGNENDCYNLNNPITIYKIHLEYNYYVSSYKLDNFPVVYGSERIEKDGVPMKRDKDYNIIYETGDINFVDKNSILPTTVIKVVYEYMPFVASNQSNLFGGILDYNLSDNIKLNSTLLYKNSSAGDTVPDARSTETALTTPFSSLILDNNINVTLSKQNINSIIGALPLVGKSDLPVDFAFTGEMAYSSFNPNTFQQSFQGGGSENGVAMIDSMESADLSSACTMTKTAWFPAAMPEFPVNLQAPDRDFMVRDQVQQQGHAPVDPNNPTSAINQVTMLKLSYSNLTSAMWDSFRYVFSPTGTNMNLYSDVEMWVYVDTNQPVKMSLDMGVISESSNGDLNFQPNEKGGAQYDSEDYAGPIGSGILPNGIFTTDKDNGISPGVYSGLPGSTPEYWGANNQYLDTEDMNNNGVMDMSEAYYQFASEGGGVNHPEFILSGNGTWVDIKIPLKDFTRAVGDVVGDPNNANFMSLIKHIRLNFVGAGGAPASGNIIIESIKFTGNSWRVQAMSNQTDAAGNAITADPTKLDAETVNHTTDPNYQYQPTYFAYTTTSDLEYETGLKLTSNLTSYDNEPSGIPLYYANKILNSTTTGYDYHAYGNIKFDMYILHKSRLGPNGRTIFLRVGSTTSYETNYFQFNQQYSDLPEGKWITVSFALDGSDGKRTTPVYPSLPNIREIQYVSLGLINPNPITDPGGETIYINNIRLTDAKTQVGSAKATSATINYQGVGSITQTYEQRDTDFSTMADAGTGAIQQDYDAQNVTFNYTQLPFMPITTTYFKTNQYTDSKYKNDIGYTNNNSLANQYAEGFTNYITFNLIPGMQLSNNSTMKSTNLEYFEPGVNDFQSNINKYSAVSPALSWTLPAKLFFIPLGTNNITAKLLYESNSFNYYEASQYYAVSSSVEAAYYNQSRSDRTGNYSWTGSYNILGLTMSPSYAYMLAEEKGNIAAAYQYYLNYLNVNVNTKLYVNDYLILRRQIDPKLSLSYPGAWIFSPQVNYTNDYSMDYTQDYLNDHGRLDVSSGIKLSQIFSWLPDITSYMFSVDNTEKYDNLQYPDSFGRFNDMTFERQWDAMLWKMILTGHNGNGSVSDREMQAYEDIASNGAFVVTHSLNLSEIKLFGFMEILPSTASYSNNTSFSSRGASMSYMENESLNIQSINFNNVTIPLPFLRDLFSKQTVSAGYSYSRQISRDSNKTIISDAITNSLKNLQLSYSTGPDGVKGAIALSGSWTNTVSGLMSYWVNNISPTLTMTYNFKIMNPITLPGWLPFIGDKTFRLDQMINVNGSIGVIKNWGGGVNDQNTHAVDSTQYALSSSAAYNVLQNLKITTELDYSHLDDMIVRTNSNDRFKISMTGEIEF